MNRGLVSVGYELHETRGKTVNARRRIDLDATTVTLKSTGKTYQFKPLGDVRPVVDAGGLFNYARQTGMIPAQVQTAPG